MTFSEAQPMFSKNHTEAKPHAFHPYSSNSTTITTTDGQNYKILNMSTTTSHTDAPLVPNVASHGPYGAIIVMNAFVAPSSATDYLKLSAPIAERFRKEPECLFCELSQNPEDPGHIRIVHGWTKDTEWLRQVSREG
jgi:hypothetical protein